MFSLKRPLESLEWLCLTLYLWGLLHEGHVKQHFAVCQSTHRSLQGFSLTFPHIFVYFYLTLSNILVFLLYFVVIEGNCTGMYLDDIWRIERWWGWKAIDFFTFTDLYFAQQIYAVLHHLHCCWLEKHAEWHDTYTWVSVPDVNSNLSTHTSVEGWKAICFYCIYCNTDLYLASINSVSSWTLVWGFLWNHTRQRYNRLREAFLASSSHLPLMLLFATGWNLWDTGGGPIFAYDYQSAR